VPEFRSAALAVVMVSRALRARHPIPALAFPVHRLQRRQRAVVRDPRPVALEARGEGARILET